MSLLTVSQRKARVLWRRENRGALARTARRFRLSGVFVCEVFYGTRSSRGHRVEAHFARLGVPGFEQFLLPAKPVLDKDLPECA